MSSELNISSILKHSGAWESLGNVPLGRPFDDSLLNFANYLSGQLLKDVEARKFPELVSLGFWMRRANLVRILENSRSQAAQHVLLPRGTVFHIAPSNVDTIFVYSWLLSMLCGNRNIIRLSSNSSPQLDLLLGIIDHCLAKPEHKPISEKISLVRYERSEEINQLISSTCDTRVIWGGDETVRAIRKAVLPPTANEVAFANKLSLCLMDYEFWASADSCRRTRIAQQFAGDAYQFGQAACSSPRVVVWFGQRWDTVEIEDFWTRVLDHSDEFSGGLKDVDFVNKLVTSQRVAIDVPVQVVPAKDNRVNRVAFDSDQLGVILESDIHCGGGQFYETKISSFEQLLPSMNRKIQTLTYAGFSPEILKAFCTSNRCQGIDRIVPIGKALDFSPIWDGFDLFEVFLRHVSIL